MEIRNALQLKIAADEIIASVRKHLNREEYENMVRAIITLACAEQAAAVREMRNLAHSIEPDLFASRH